MFEFEEQDREFKHLLSAELTREAREGIPELDRRMERVLKPKPRPKSRTTKSIFLAKKVSLRRALAFSLIASLCLGLGIYLGHSFLNLGYSPRQAPLPLVLVETYSQPEVTIARSGAEDPRKMALDAASKVSDLTKGNIPTLSSYDSPVQVTPERSNIDEPRGYGERALDSSGDLFIAESAGGRILKITPDGEEIVIAEGLSHPTGLTLDSAGNLYVAESGKGRMLQIKPDKSEITPKSKITVFAIGFSSALEFERGPEQGLHGPLYLVSNEAGDLFVADRTSSATIIYKISPKFNVQVSESEGKEGD